MKTEKRFVLGLVVGISTFICLASALLCPSDSQSYSILHHFTGGASDGFHPWYGGPVFSESTLYGMTAGAGANGTGTLFKINTDGTGFQILHTFGVPCGDGTGPRGSLTLSGSTLYGFTAYGGSPCPVVGGTVFKMDTGGGGYQILHNFGAGFNQTHPYGAPIISGSKLYGMTSSENAGLNGAIFVMNAEGGGPNFLHEFGGKPNDGALPYGSLTLVGSKLYGMTSTGGSGGISGGGSGHGVIFSLNTDGTEYKVLHKFRRLSGRWK